MKLQVNEAFMFLIESPTGLLTLLNESPFRRWAYLVFEWEGWTTIFQQGCVFTWILSGKWGERFLFKSASVTLNALGVLHKLRHYFHDNKEHFSLNFSPSDYYKTPCIAEKVSLLRIIISCCGAECA